MSMRHTPYHATLRVSAALVALGLLFVSGVVNQTTALIAEDAAQNIATAIGMSLGVTPNELNQITAVLTEREQQLNQRETAIRDREIELGLAAGSSGTDTSTYILSAILFILLLMIVFNYILDFSRNQMPYSQVKSGFRPTE